MNVVGQWFTWTPNSGPLGISLGGLTIGSLWFPKPSVAVACAGSGGTFHNVQPSTDCERVPVQANNTLVTLSGSGASPLAVFASNLAYPPYKGGP